MKTTQRILVGWIAVAMSISAGLASAGLPRGMAIAWLGGAALGQQGGSGSIFSGFSSSPAAPPNDPFATRGPAMANGASRLPPTTNPQSQPPAGDYRYADTGSTSPQYLPSGQYAAVNVNQASNGGAQAAPPGGNRAHSDGLLRAARLALAVTDVRRSGDLLAQARQEQIRYAPNEDSPERVEAAIARFIEVNRLDRATEENRKTYAHMLMEQSEALLQWGELEQADKLAALAVEQRVAYGPFDAKPDDLLKRIAALRQQHNPAGPRLIDSRFEGPNAVGPSLAGRREAIDLMRQIRGALAAGQIGTAESLCRQLDTMRMPDSAFGPGEDTPRQVFHDVTQAMARNTSSVIQAGGVSGPNQGVQNAVYDPSRDPTHNMQVGVQQAAESIPTPPTEASPGDGQRQSPGYSLFQQGVTALKARERDRALQLFQQASAYSNDLDQATAARLQDYLSLLSVPRGGPPRTSPAGQPNSPVDEAVLAQQALLRRVYADVNHREAEAKQMLEKDPKGSLAELQESRKQVESAGLDPAARDQLLRRLDRVIADTQHYIEQNHTKIDLEAKNEGIRGDLTRENNVKLQTQQKLAELVDQYNRLIEEQRFEEAEVIAKRAQELAPHEMVTQVMVTKISLLRHMEREKDIKGQIEEKFGSALDDVDEAAIPFSGKDPMLFPDAKNWKDMTHRRAARQAQLNRRRRSEKEIDIEKKLQTPVNYSCRNRPLSEVLNQLARLVNVNIHLDDDGLREEGTSPDTPVTLELASDIQLKSYLNLILEKHHLCYIIKNEVLNITSETRKGEHVYQQVYPVGDLVMPIPNFVASPRMGLAGALHDAMGDAVGTSSGFGTNMTPTAVASRDGQRGNATISNASMMANMAPPLGGGNRQMGAGPGGAGGGTAADFDTLIDLITQTVSPASWDHNGGKGNIAASPTNLSLVVSQTQEVHEEIVDLLEQLRRMQDLQVTIEVRFITLNDNFFERIGVDFDFNIAKNIANPQAAGFTAPIANAGGSGLTAPAFITGANNNSVAVPGLQASGNNPAQSGIFTTDLSIPFQQGSYALAVPQFGGFDAGAGATVGFAILSDIEAYFFINAAQGDKRTNVLQAPKVTLFNGQQAFVSDTSQTPFVISVIPVVGDFAAAQQPVIVVLSEGTFMTVQAVVSNDRRFVRLTIVPFFSKIGNVQTFTFQGTQTTTQNTTRNGIVDAANNLFNNNTNQNTTTNSGVTVQLPTFSFVTVTTTVSVPDGGTVLLGGIKRLSEGRVEDGVPILDKVPYLDRLFKNVGIGRETSSLMMMVTPRIIIQEEEEDKMGISTTP